MFGFWRSFGALIPIATVAGFGLIGLLAMWRRADRHVRCRIALAFLSIWLLGIALVTLRPQPQFLDSHNVFHSRQINAKPLSEISDALFNSVTWRVAAEQIGGNIFLFSGVGFAFAMFWTVGIAPRWVGLASGFVLGSAIEATQWFLSLGRISSIDDIILSTLGAAIGFCIGIAALRPSESARWRRD